MPLEDRVAIVSGIGPGTGRAVALALAREGAHVALGARNEARLRDVAAEVEALGRTALWRVCDIADEAQCAALADAVRSELGTIDVLVNNAFVEPPMKPIVDTSTEEWRRALDVNVLGSLQMTRAVLPAMRAQRRGSIVFIGSMVVREPGEGLGPYAAAKAALLLTAQTLAREVGPDGVRVNTVVPGYIWGPNLKYWFTVLAEREGTTRDAIYDRHAASMALRRIPSPEEVAEAVTFFASDRSSAITGQSLDVNGGQLFR